MQPTPASTAINPDALRAYRKKAGFQTQAQLAEKLECPVDQVNRWETGRTKKPRAHLRNKLTAALGVSWEELTQPPTGDVNPLDVDLRTVQLNRRVGKPTRTALEVVSAIYGVRQRDIIELGPVLFHIAAQQSLQTRERALNEAVDQIEEAASAAGTSLPYMSGAFYGNYDHQWIQEEYASIKAKLVFKSYEAEDGEVHSPFVTHLNGLLEGLAEHEMQVSPNWSGRPEYQFPLKYLQAIAGISGDGETDQKILDAIQDGDLDLQEVRAKKAKLEVDEFRRWLEGRYREVLADMEAEREAQNRFWDGVLQGVKSHKDRDTDKSGESEE